MESSLNAEIQKSLVYYFNYSVNLEFFFFLKFLSLFIVRIERKSNIDINLDSFSFN